MLPVLSACNQTDDVIDIFTGKTWKLTSIFYDKGNKDDVCMDYWANDAAYQASVKLLNTSGNFTINFTGAEMDGDVTGTYSGRSAGSAISGQWQANGKNNYFNISNATGGSGGDVLGQAYIDGLANADKYDGDTNGNLRIYFKDKAGTRRFLLFHINTDK